MKISSLPENYSGAFSQLLYEISEVDPKCVLEVGILEKDGSILGIKKFSRENNYIVNIAPYVPSKLSVEPVKEENTGFYEKKTRSFKCHIIVTESQNNNYLVSESRTFTAGSLNVNTDGTLSECEGIVNIGSSEFDDISFIAPGKNVYSKIKLIGKSTEETLFIGKNFCKSIDNLIYYPCSDNIESFFLNISDLDYHPEKIEDNLYIELDYIVPKRY